MKKSLRIAISCFLACISLAGCSLPGMGDQSDDDFTPDGYGTNSGDGSDKTANYSWIVEPTINANNIIVFDASQIDADKESNTAYLNLAIIVRDGYYGFIDYYGNVMVEPTYKYYYSCACGEMVLYNITDVKNDVREYCSVDSQGQVLNYAKEHEDYSPNYYWNSDDNSVYVLDSNEELATKYTGKKTVVVAKADVSDAGNGYYSLHNVDDTAFALVKENKLISEFEYDDFYAPAFKGAGLTAIALKQDSHWGYVSSSGEEIISFKCDGVLSAYCGDLIDNEEHSHPYLFTEEFIPVSVNSTYGYYDMSGDCIVPVGEFEQARPVHNGRAWVRKNGLWGVIQLGEVVEESKPDKSSKAMTTVTSFTWTAATTTTSGTTATTTTSGTTVVDTSKNSDNGSTTKKTTKASVTDPPVTDPPVTDPPVTDPPVTDPPVTDPPDPVPAGE